VGPSGKLGHRDRADGQLDGELAGIEVFEVDDE
jgi:hypothetical protein